MPGPVMDLGDDFRRRLLDPGAVAARRRGNAELFPSYEALEAFTASS